MIDPTTALVVTAGFQACAVVFKKVEGKLAEDLATAIHQRVREMFGKDPDAKDPAQAEIQVAAALKDPDPELRSAAGLYLGESSAMRRAARVADCLEGARILWVDDDPAGNHWEIASFRALGCEVMAVDTSAAALSALRSDHWDLLVSDMKRGDDPEAGLSLRDDIHEQGLDLYIVFYVGRLDRTKPVPVGTKGITANPDELLHLVLDVLERIRL